MSRRFSMLLLIGITAIAAAVFAYYNYKPNAVRVNKFYQWIRNPAAHPDWKLAAGSQCGAAPFLFPTDGFAGFLWGDPFGFRKTHQGIDVFAGTDAGITPVVAAYPGYLTRQADWKSAVIVRVPDDPLQPGRQIWLYYTHMADPNGNSYISVDFPPGTSEVPIEAGTLLGFQGNYTGDPANPSGIHLHFSIVLDDGQGQFLNELKIRNTLDPSPYFGIPLDAQTAPDEALVCAN